MTLGVDDVTVVFVTSVATSHFGRQMSLSSPLTSVEASSVPQGNGLSAKG